MVIENSLILGDCIEKLKEFPENSIDLVVTDPPYGIDFMRDWDTYLPPKEAFSEMVRVLKPGAIAFIMSSPRQDALWRMLQLLETAGFNIRRNFLNWIYLTGFPKAYDVSKGIDKKLGLERPIIEKKRRMKRMVYTKGFTGDIVSDIPISEEAEKWDGWKSLGGLKPAFECIIMAVKPMESDTISNLRKWGTGAINVGVCHIPNEDGYYPSDLLSSNGSLGKETKYFDLDAWGKNRGIFKVPKASTSEREEGLGESERMNEHPTVKPLKLMAYLIELGCPLNGIVLDPFMGTGTTCIAAKMLGRKYIGIEIEKTYFEIAQKRVENATTNQNESTLDKF